MVTIHKYNLEPDRDGRIEIETHWGAKALTVQVQRGAACLWMLVDTNKPTGVRSFLVRGTGHDCSNAANYIGTFQIDEGDGALVFHLFEAK